jgi:predicted RecA/RadA family phage recombinase
MATKTWQINTLQRELADGYVNKVIFRVNGEDGDYSFRATGEVDLPKPSTLVPYKDLTEATVIKWVKDKLDADNAGTVARIEAAVEKAVNEQKTPTTGVGKPW